MFYATAGHSDGGEFYGACLVEASGLGHAQMRAVVLGVMSTRIIPLPRLTDQIPSTYFERFLYTHDLSEIDVILGGDGTGMVPADQRDIDEPS